MDTWRLRGNPAPALRRAVLTSVPVGAALLLDLEYDQDVAGAIATASFVAAIVAFDAPARTRVRWQLIFAPALGAAGALGALTGRPAVLAVVTLSLVAACGGYFAAGSPRLAIAGAMLVLAVLLAQGIDPGAGAAGRVFLVGLAGGLLQVAVGLVALSWDRDREGSERAEQARWDRNRLRPALRAGLAFAPAAALSHLDAFGDHGYWIPLTVLFVLRPNAVDTRGRIAMRAAGTVAGLLLATGLAETIGDQPVLLALAITVAGAVALAMLALEYALFTAAITTFAVLIAESIGTPTLRAVDERAVATAIGIVIAACAVLVWPDRRREAPADG